MKNIFGFCICILAISCLTLAPSPLSAADAEKKEWKIPADARWFGGILEGDVVSKNVEEPSIVLKVKKVVKTLDGNRAKKADMLKGEKAVILTQPVFKDGKILTDEKLAEFVKEVKVGASLEVTVKSDGLGRLRMIEVPKAIKK